MRTYSEAVHSNADFGLEFALGAPGQQEGGQRQLQHKALSRVLLQCIEGMLCIPIVRTQPQFCGGCQAMPRQRDWHKSKMQHAHEGYDGKWAHPVMRREESAFGLDLKLKDSLTKGDLPGEHPIPRQGKHWPCQNAAFGLRTAELVHRQHVREWLHQKRY